jgi:hypothetical protein
MASPRELAEAIIASLIFAMGLVAGAFAGSRRSSVDRTPVWFGLFACLYGVRLAGHSQLIQPALPEISWRYLDALITYAIIVPGGLFIETVFGPGWRLTLRRTWQAAAVYAFLAIVHDLVRRQPGATLWLNLPAVLIVGGIATAHVLTRWRREGWPREFRVAVLGGLLFAGIAAYETLGGDIQLEPLAMLVFMASMFLVTVCRRRWWHRWSRSRSRQRPGALTSQA